MEKPNGNLGPGQKYDSAMDNPKAPKGDVEGKPANVLEQPEYVGKGAVLSGPGLRGSVKSYDLKPTL